MSILRIASFKASYALFLKLVSGTIRTIAISASAIVGGALVCLRAGTTDLLQGDVSYPKNVEFIFGIPNARMSSYPYFQHFHLVPCLDNFVSGIPNAITSQSVALRMPQRTRTRLPSPGISIECAQAATVLMPARVADESRNRRQGEEANVEF